MTTYLPTNTGALFLWLHVITWPSVAHAADHFGQVNLASTLCDHVLMYCCQFFANAATLIGGANFLWRAKERHLSDVVLYYGKQWHENGIVILSIFYDTDKLGLWGASEWINCLSRLVSPIRGMQSRFAFSPRIYVLGFACCGVL